MASSSFIKKALESLGKNNDPTYVVVGIATAKGIFRPLFTMMDKKEAPETKKYAALREGMTEVIAIPTYIGCGWLASKGAALCKDPTKAAMAKHNLKFLGVCVAALLVIPGLCSVVVKPFTEKIFNKHKKEDTAVEPARLDVVSATPEVQVTQQKPQISQTGNPANITTPLQKISITSFTNSGMKVG